MFKNWEICNDPMENKEKKLILWRIALVKRERIV